jgi:hypothetical protein
VLTVPLIVPPAVSAELFRIEAACKRQKVAYITSFGDIIFVIINLQTVK